MGGDFSENGPNEGVERPKAWIFKIFVVFPPVILSWYVTETDMLPSWLNKLSIGTGNRDNKVIFREVEMGKEVLAERDDEATRPGRKELEPAGANIHTLKPMRFARAVLGGINWSIFVYFMKSQEDFFGAAELGEPVTNESNFYGWDFIFWRFCYRGLQFWSFHRGSFHLAPFRVSTAFTVRARI